MFAAEAGHADVLDKLLTAGAKVDATNSSGLTSLMFAARKGQLMAATRLLDSGADPDQQTKAGRTAGTDGCCHDGLSGHSEHLARAPGTG